MRIDQLASRGRKWLTGRRLALGVALALAVPVSGCDTLLEVEDPDIVLPPNLDTPEAVATVYGGALGDFTVAFSGPGGNNTTLTSAVGLFTDEFLLSGTFPTRNEMDRREINERNGTMDGVFRNIQRARVAVENAAATIEEFSDDPATDDRIPEMLALAGFTYLFLGENYCNGVPLSSVEDDGSLNHGSPLPYAEMFNLAIQRFDESLGHSASGGAIANLALVGKARAQLNLNQVAAAATTVATVPDGFTYMIGHSDNDERQENNIWAVTGGATERFSLWDTEGVNGLPYRTANDPRVPWQRVPANNVGFDSQTPHFTQLVYDDRDDPYPLANGIEARLIEAEAALRNNDFASWASILQTLRNNSGMDFSASTVPTVTDQGSLAANVTLHFRERAFWLVFSAHRLGDMRRLVRQYGRLANAVFPTGTYLKGGIYGTQVSFPVPFDERNNPNFSGCTNLDP